MSGPTMERCAKVATAVCAGVATLLTCDVVVALAFDVVEQAVAPIQYSRFFDHFHGDGVGGHVHSQVPPHVWAMDIRSRCESFAERVANRTAAPPPSAPPNAALRCQQYEPFY